MDKITPEKRSWNMTRIKSSNTKPEVVVRKFLWSLGYRYRLYKKSLPGKPDIFIPKIKTAVFINGCFWHQHPGCKRSTMPKSRIDYWKPKLERNVKRQAEQLEQLRQIGINSLIFWECEAKNADILTKKITAIAEFGHK